MKSLLCTPIHAECAVAEDDLFEVCLSVVVVPPSSPNSTPSASPVALGNIGPFGRLTPIPRKGGNPPQLNHPAK